eukprot:13736522-Heterocapsa_arctica.AAC.1
MPISLAGREGRGGKGGRRKRGAGFIVMCRRGEGSKRSGERSPDMSGCLRGARGQSRCRHRTGCRTYAQRGP